MVWSFVHLALRRSLELILLCFRSTEAKEMALLRAGRRMATLRAVTPCRVAVVPNDRIDRQALEQLAKGR